MAQIRISTFIKFAGWTQDQVDNASIGWIYRVRTTLENTGWSVINVIGSPAGDTLVITADVNGSNSDSMSAVVNSFNRVMSQNGIIVTNTTARFLSQDSTVITGTNPSTGRVNTTTTPVPNPTPANNTQPGFLDSFAKSLGVSSAILAIAGIAILIVVIKE